MRLTPPLSIPCFQRTLLPPTLQASKVVSHISNVVIALFAILFIAIGAAALNQLEQFGSFYKVTIPSGIIVLGVFLLLVPILGFWGTIKEKKIVLIIYCFILFIFVICEFGVGGGAYTMRNQIPGQLENQWENLSPAGKEAIEERFECCGFRNVTDDPSPDCLSEFGNSTSITGCGFQLVQFFQSSLYAVGTVAVIFATFQLAGLIFALIVFIYLREDGNAQRL